MSALTTIARRLIMSFTTVLTMWATECVAQQWIKPSPPRFSGEHVVKQALGVTTAPEWSPVVLEGNIIRKLSYTRYVFKDRSGTAMVHIPQYVFGLHRVYADTKVRLTGQILGKYPTEFYDPHARILYLEILK